MKKSQILRTFNNWNKIGRDYEPVVPHKVDGKTKYARRLVTLKLLKYRRSGSTSLASDASSKQSRATPQNRYNITLLSWTDDERKEASTEWIAFISEAVELDDSILVKKLHMSLFFKNETTNVFTRMPVNSHLIRRCHMFNSIFLPSIVPLLNFHFLS